MEVKQKTVPYLGIEEPSTPQEIGVEIAGLEVAKSQIDVRIAQLKQAFALVRASAESAEVKASACSGCSDKKCEADN